MDADDWDERRTRSAYDEVAQTYAAHFTATEPEQPVDLAMIEHFVSLLDSSRRVLDAGCGAGRLMPFLARHGCRVTGVDLAPAMVACARRDHPQHETVLGSLTDLPFSEAAFDGFFSWYSTIHAPERDVARMLGQAHRVLAPAGVALLAFQTGDGARDVAQGYRDRGHEVTLMRWGRTVHTMRELAAAAGFRPVACLDRDPVGAERDGQAVLVLRKQPL